MSKIKSPDSASKSPKTRWDHYSNCVDDEGRIVCCCPLRESVDLYDQSVSEWGLQFRSEEA